MISAEAPECRTLTLSCMPETEPEIVTGIVLRASGAIYEVDGPDAAGGVLLCTLRGKLKHGRRAAAQPVSVGDNVRVRVLASTGADARGRRLREGYIEEVLPR